MKNLRVFIDDLAVNLGGYLYAPGKYSEVTPRKTARLTGVRIKKRGCQTEA